MGHKQSKGKNKSPRTPRRESDHDSPKRSDSEKSQSDKRKDSPESFTLTPELEAKLSAETYFEKVEVQKLYEVFRSVTDNGKKPVTKNFAEAMSKLTEFSLPSQESPFADRLFDLLDTNRDGTVDLQEFVSGLSLLCKGTPEEKLRLSFQAYDLDGNGYITQQELTEMFRKAWLAGYRALVTLHGIPAETSISNFESFAADLAKNFAASVFETLDTNRDGKLSFEEFKRFALADPKITATLNEFKQEVKIVLS